MPKILVVLMEQQYPFEPAKHPTNTHEASVIVRQSLPTRNTEKSQILAKATFLKNLRSKNLVKLQSILEEQNFIHLQYQFIQSQNDWNQDSYLKNRIHNQLKNLVNYLTNIGVKTNLERNRIGVTNQNVVKYFLGLEFEWDNSDDQNQLLGFYQAQLYSIFGASIVKNPTPSPSCEVVPFNSWPQSEIPVQECHDRKVSFASIPSRYNRLIKIDQQLHQMKSIQKQPNSCRPNYIKNFLRSQTPQESIIHRFDSPKSIINRINKKYENRKYSGDLKFTMFANKKLAEKQSDIKSERGGLRNVSKMQNRHINENNQEEIQTVNSKSRIQEMKYQQYLQITKSNKKYLQDFISVLEDDEPETMASGFQFGCKSIKYSNGDKDTETYNSYYETTHNYQKQTKLNHAETLNNEICVWKNTEELQRRAREAIKNSKIAIRKIRSIPTDSVQSQ